MRSYWRSFVCNIANSVEMYEAQLAQKKHSNLSVGQQICMTILNTSEICVGKIPVKLTIAPILLLDFKQVLIGLRPRKFTEQTVNVTAPQERFMLQNVTKQLALFSHIITETIT